MQLCSIFKQFEYNFVKYAKGKNFNQMENAYCNASFGYCNKQSLIKKN